MSSVLGFFQGAYPNLHRHFTTCMFSHEVVNPFHYVKKTEQHKKQLKVQILMLTGQQYNLMGERRHIVT